MNPHTNRFEELTEVAKEDELLEGDKRLAALYKKVAKVDPSQKEPTLLRPDGSPVPAYWSTFRNGEEVVIKDYTFKIAHIGESYMILEPVGPALVGKIKDEQ
jgi:hypothetical protein